MEPSERLVAFKQIKEHFDGLDREGLRHGTLPMHTTEFGFWGTTNMNDAYTFFTRIHLERFKGFADLGCGDGRIVLIASLFTDAVGVEGDEELVEIGNRAKNKLGFWVLENDDNNGKNETKKRDDLLHSAMLKNKNYYDEDLSQYDIIFMFPDNRFDSVMISKLLKEFHGYLFIYNRIHSPLQIKAGKTYWIDQMPIASFPINVEEQNLELR